jgi:diguanylate cyclase (GGDEF)-like protein
MSTDDDGLSQAITDPLTGAYSRGLLGPRLAEEISRASRSHTGCALFLFDLDYFKSINDAYGHQRGDEILVQLTERINGLVRGYDVLFRYGGDEFVLLLPETDKADATRVALRLAEGVKAEPYPGDPPLSVSVSVGVAAFPDDAADAEGLLAAADRRNYIAKHRGRACAVADDVEAEVRSASSRLLERDLQLGLAREFLTRIAIGERGSLAVTGDRGAGFSRFLEELARAGQLRGFDVVATADVSTVDIGGNSGRPLLVILDADVDERVLAMAQGLDGRAAVGVVFRVLAEAGEVPDLPGLPRLDTVELSAWSSAAMRIWLRTTLQGEPDPVLVDWLAGRTGGLPARVARDVQRLADRNGLVRDGRGGWSLTPAMLGRAAQRRPLPKPLTELVGRQLETAQVAHLLTERRLVTLIGPAGIGKTRLALAVATAVADTFDDGAVHVPLAAARTTEDVLLAIAQAFDVSEAPGVALGDALGEHLSQQSVLVLLDNFEHVMDAAPVLGALLDAAPGVRALVSSREKLHLYGEQAYQVPPLALPDLAALPPGAAAVGPALAHSPALALFNARARAAAYNFILSGDNLESIVALCRRLDGLPLAIELAAAHCDVLTPAAILAQLSDRLDLPGTGPRGVPARQQTLRGAIDWSYTLLEPQDQDLLVRLGAFSGGCRLDAVAAVCAGRDWHDRDHLEKGLTRLADKSLVRAEPDTVDGTRYVLLETVRAYALERLAEHAEADDIQEMHAAHYSALANRAGFELTGPGQADWVAHVQREYQNLRTAFEVSTSTGNIMTALEVAVGLWRYWRNRGQLREGREWLDQLLSTPLPAVARARGLHAAAVLAAAQDDHEGASRLAREGRELAMAAGDARVAAQAGNALGIAMMAGGQYAEARTVFAECLDSWNRLDDPVGRAMAHGNLTMVALRLGELETASEHAARCLLIEREAGNTRGIMLALLCFGEISIRRGDVPAAQRQLDEALALSRQISDVFGEAMALHQLGEAALRGGDPDTAIRQVAAGLALRRDLDDRDGLALSLEALGGLLRFSTPTLAARLLGAADGLRLRHRLPVPAERLAERDAALVDLTAALGTEAAETARLTGGYAAVDSVVDEVLEHVEQRFR